MTEWTPDFWVAAVTAAPVLLLAEAVSISRYDRWSTRLLESEDADLRSDIALLAAMICAGVATLFSLFALCTAMFSLASSVDEVSRPRIAWAITIAGVAVAAQALVELGVRSLPGADPPEET